jgi:hypothetical protein
MTVFLGLDDFAGAFLFEGDVAVAAAGTAAGTAAGLEAPKIVGCDDLPAAVGCSEAS